ncbi:MAG: HNH endonuclease [Muribaculaceae bacterium]|nr:HNH endonuclease [Muribaculaceae bacterium]
MSKDANYIRLIHTARWLSLRRWKLERQPLCETCMDNGQLTPATEVHHVIPAETAITSADMEGLMYDPHNLRSLCHACHIRAHMELGSRSRKMSKQRTAERLRRFADKYPTDENDRAHGGGGSM